MRHPAIVLLVLTVLTTSSIAPTRAGAQERAFVPCAQPGLAALAFVVGTWNVHAEVRLSAEGPWESSTGTSVITRDMRGCLFTERFEGTRQNRPFEARTILALHPDRRAVQRLFADSEHGFLIIAEGSSGEARSPSGDLELFADVETRFGPVRLRTAYREITTGDFLVESARSTDGGTTWDVTSRLRYTRTGTPGPGHN